METIDMWELTEVLELLQGVRTFDEAVEVLKSELPDGQFEDFLWELYEVIGESELDWPYRSDVITHVWLQWWPSELVH